VSETVFEIVLCLLCLDRFRRRSDVGASVNRTFRRRKQIWYKLFRRRKLIETYRFRRRSDVVVFFFVSDHKKSVTFPMSFRRRNVEFIQKDLVVSDVVPTSFRCCSVPTLYRRRSDY